jgi:Protein of unknown function (DUF2844)
MVVGLALLGLTSLPAAAGLGGNADSVQADGAHMKAQNRGSVSAVGYSVDQLTLPSGTVVREYLTPDGIVFGVSWQGPTMPDLREIFGSYFEQYVAASESTGHNAGTRRHFEVKQGDLVVQSNGRMRDYYGRAYVPSLLPPNVTAADIQ